MRGWSSAWDGSVLRKTGWLQEDPIAFRLAKPAYIAQRGIGRQRMFFPIIIRNFDGWPTQRQSRTPAPQNWRSQL